MQYMCKFLHMWHNFCICISENAIICGKICNMRVLAKYVKPKSALKLKINQYFSYFWFMC